MSTSLDRTTLIASNLGSLQSRPGGDRGVALAEALLWPADQLERKPVVSMNVDVVTRVNAGGQAVAVFSYSESNPSETLVSSVALYAYQASIDWGVVGNSAGITIFNSHWVKDGEWFSLPLIPWAKVQSGLDILDGLTPDGLTDGLIDRVALRFSKPDQILIPIDDALVSRLDFWRREMARYAPSMTQADNLIHKLFAQFFVLRAAEDRKLTSTLPTLLSCVDEEKAPFFSLQKVRALYKLAAAQLQTELFDEETVSSIPPEVLAGVANDLYYPNHLPAKDARYDFSWIDADVLGRAYEKYLSQLLQLSSRPTQMSLLQSSQPLREIDTFRNKKSAGIYYTPSFLVSFLTKEAVDSFSPSIDRIPRIVDPSCGSGSFLTGSISYISHLLSKTDPNKNWAREIVTRGLICGIDSDPRAVLLAKLSIWLRIAEEPMPLPLPALDEIIIEGDALSESTWAKLPSDFDIVLGNPPFVPTGELEARSKLEANFLSARGRFDYAYLFLEMGLRRLGDGGKLGMVLPNRLFRNRDAGAARAMFTDCASLDTVTDFGSNEVFRGVSAYIGAVLGTKGKTFRGKGARYIKVLEMAPRLMNLVLGAGVERETTNAYLQSFDIQQPQLADPWLGLSPATRSARFRLEDLSVPLSEIADVFQGIKVGANDLFVVKPVGDDSGPVIQVRNGLGDLHLIESTLLHPVVFGSQIEAYGALDSKSLIIYPYLRGKVLDEDALSQKYPLTYDYLSANRKVLESRTSVISSGRFWYELVRHRDQSKLESPKLMMRDLAMKTAFAMDDLGGVYLVGGTAVLPNDFGMLKPLLAYLNSVMSNWYLAPITPLFRGEFQKFEPQHLNSLPILRDIFEDDSLRDRLSTLVDVCLSQEDDDLAGSLEAIREIDLLLCQRIGIDPLY